MWNIELDDEFALWLNELEENVADKILAHARLLQEFGPQLGRPHAETVNGSRYPNMKEFRIQINGAPWRILFAFDPRRTGILLVGGNKQGDKRWYKTHIPIADGRYERHLERLAHSEP